MNPDPRAAVETHVRCWNEQRREEWIANFHPECTFDDPVGAPTKRGREAIELSWDRSHRDGRRWILEPRRIIVGGDEAAVIMDNHGHVDGKHVVVHGVEIWKVGPDGRVIAVRAYFEPPTEVALDPYFHHDRPA
jgi:hypothetical protein